VDVLQTRYPDPGSVEGRGLCLIVNLFVQSLLLAFHLIFEVPIVLFLFRCSAHLVQLILQHTVCLLSRPGLGGMGRWLNTALVARPDLRWLHRLDCTKSDAP